MEKTGAALLAASLMTEGAFGNAAVRNAANSAALENHVVIVEAEIVAELVNDGLAHLPHGV